MILGISLGYNASACIISDDGKLLYSGSEERFNNRKNTKMFPMLSIKNGTYEDWFRETVARAAEIYEYAERTGEEVPSFSYQYIWDFSPLLENRLQTGGYRLAYVLNTIFN